MRVLGIDEAGRGCVLGPLVVGAFLVDGVEDALLWQAGAADSKRLSARRRLEVRARLEVIGEAIIHRISPAQIDTGNLNTLEEEAIVSLVRLTRPDRVIIDALGPPKSLPSVCARLAAASAPEANPEWTMEPKADANHAVVAAASIFAKTTRDAALEALEEQWGGLGTGYPSDPKTRSWLEGWARRGEDWPPFVRTKWKTISELGQTNLF